MTADPFGGLTVRLAADGLIVSDDHGRTWKGDPADAAAVRRTVVGVLGGRAPLPRPVATACCAGSLAEAAAGRPVDARGGAVVPVGQDHWVQARLGEPSGAAAAGRPADGPAAAAFDALLTHRRSAPPQSAPPAQAVEDLVRMVRRTRDTAHDADGRRWTSRPVPSAGGTHSVDLLVRTACGTGPRWHGWSDRHQRLVPAAGLPAPHDAVAAAAVRGALRQDADPPVTVLAVCDTRLLLQRYPAGTPLLWLDAGAALMAVHLAASALGLDSTVVGAAVVLPDSAASPGAAPVAVVGAVAVGGDGQDG